MKDRLIELLRQGEAKCAETKTCNKCEQYGRGSDCQRNLIADHLIANGVIVPPVKVGQTCYKVYMGEILEIKVTSISYEPLPAFTYTIRFNSLGVLCLDADGTRNDKYSWLIFLTKEEAEKALKESEGK